MLKQPFPGKLFQIGYVVPDLDEALAHLTDKLGVPRFLTRRNVGAQNNWFRGNSGDIIVSMAFGYMGDMNIEVIQPLEGQSTYMEYLKRVPEGGVHHFGYQVDDYSSAEKAMVSRGFSKIQSGNAGPTQFCYFESNDDPGTLAEIVCIGEEGRAMFQSIKDQTF